MKISSNFFFFCFLFVVLQTALAEAGVVRSNLSWANSSSDNSEGDRSFYFYPDRHEIKINQRLVSIHLNFFLRLRMKVFNELK